MRRKRRKQKVKRENGENLRVKKRKYMRKEKRGVKEVKEKREGNGEEENRRVIEVK